MALQWLNKSRKINWIQIIDILLRECCEWGAHVTLMCRLAQHPAYEYTCTIVHCTMYIHISVFTLETVENGSECKRWYSTQSVFVGVRCVLVGWENSAHVYPSSLSRSEEKKNSNNNKVTIHYRTIATLRHHYNCLNCYCLNVCIWFIFRSALLFPTLDAIFSSPSSLFKFWWLFFIFFRWSLKWLFSFVIPGRIWHNCGMQAWHK